MSMSNVKLVRIYVVIADGPGDGPAGDGTFINRFKSERTATAFAATATCYGRAATVTADDVPRRLAQRWNVQ